MNQAIQQHITPKYLELAIQMIQLYQKYLLEFLYKHNNNRGIISFRSQFEKCFQRLRGAEVDKSIQDVNISFACTPMNQFLNKNNKLKIKNPDSVHSARYQGKNNQSLLSAHQNRDTLGSRQNPRFRFTGMKRTSKKIQPGQIQQIPQQSHQIKIKNKNKKDMPKMTMRWMSFKQSHQLSVDSIEQVKKGGSLFGANNIELLSQTIPEIQDSIKRLSLPHERSCGVQIHRTIDWKAQSRKKYIARLF